MTTRPKHVVCIVGLAGFTFVSLASIDTWDLIWEDYFDRGSYDAFRRIAAAEGRVFAIGPTITEGRYDMGIRVYNATDGDPIWQHYFDRVGDDDEPTDVAVAGGRVFVTGFTTKEDGNKSITILSYGIDNGTLLWEKHFNQAERCAASAYGVAADGERVFVGGISSTCGINLFTVLAYRAEDGTLSWSNFLRRDSLGRDLEGGTVVWGGRSVIVHDSKVFAVGGNHYDNKTRFSIVAYRAEDGEVIWDCHFPLNNKDPDLPNLHPNIFGGEANCVAAEGNRVFVGGVTHFNGTGRYFSVLAFDASNGTLLWQNHFDRAGGYEVVRNLAVGWGRVFAVGLTTNSRGDWDFTIRAYRETDGELLWEDYLDLAGGKDMANDVAVVGTQVIVVGEATDANGTLKFVVRAYSLDGTLVWEDRFDRAGFGSCANTMATLGNRVFAGGGTAHCPALSCGDFAIRAYGRKWYVFLPLLVKGWKR
jgi:hypothetical protein